MKFFIVVCLFCITVIAQSQGVEGIKRLDSLENEVNGLFELLYSDGFEPVDSLNQEILTKLQMALQTPEGYSYPWADLKRTGKVFSEDRKVKIFTWLVPGKGSDSDYSGLLAFYSSPGRNRKKRSLKITVIPLISAMNFPEDPGLAVCSPDKWFGAVYYRIREFEHQRHKWYVLTGIDLKDQFSNRKILEVLRFNQGKPVFGGEFILNDDKQCRMVFEYSERVAMSLNFDEKMNMFVFDHLAPLEAVFTGNYQFYTPDGSFDGLRFEKGRFVLAEDVDARNF